MKPCPVWLHRFAVGSVLAAGTLVLALSCTPERLEIDGPAALPVPETRLLDGVDRFLAVFAAALDDLEAALAAEPAISASAVLAKLSAVLEVVRLGPEPDAPLADDGTPPPVPLFCKGQRLKMDSLVSRFRALQPKLAAAMGGPGGGRAVDRIEALTAEGAVQADYDQVLERFSRGLDAYETAIKRGNPDEFAPIGLLVQADARRAIAIGSNGSPAQRIQALSLSGRFADLAGRAAALPPPKPSPTPKPTKKPKASVKPRS